MSYCPTGAAGSHRSSTWPCPRGSLGRGDQDLRRDPTRPGPRGQLDPGDRTPALPSPEPDTATYAHVRTIEPLAPGVPVEGRVAFAGNARPKGMADGVCHVSDLTEELRSLCQERVSTALDEAWARIPRATPSDRAARLEHLEGLRAGHGRVRGAWFLGLVCGLGGLDDRAWALPAPDGPMARWMEASTPRVPHAQGSSPDHAPRVAAVQPTTPHLQRVAPATPQASTPRRSRATGDNAHPDRAAQTQGDHRVGDSSAPPRRSTRTVRRRPAGVLIGNTAETRRDRDRACGPPGRR